MSKRAALLLNLLLVLALLAFPTLAGAAPLPPTGSDASAGAPPVPFVNVPGPQASLPIISSSALDQAIAFKASLSAEQQTALKAIANKYQPQLQALSASLPAPQAFRSLNAPEPLGKIRAQLAREVANVHSMRDLQNAGAALQNGLQAEVMAVLSPEQAAQFKAGLAPAREALQASAARAIAASGDTPATVSRATTFTANYCYYSAYYASLADFYAWQGYLLAYSNYSLYTTGSYYAYYYGYWAQYYMQIGTLYAGGAYFDVLNFNADRNGFLAKAMTNLNSGYTNAYYSHYYAYNNWVAYPTQTQAYDAYVWMYWAYYYGYYGNYYGTACQA